MRFYIIGNDGNVWAEADTQERAESKLNSFSQADIEEYELEVVAGD